MCLYNAQKRLSSLNNSNMPLMPLNVICHIETQPEMIFDKLVVYSRLCGRWLWFAQRKRYTVRESLDSALSLWYIKESRRAVIGRKIPGGVKIVKPSTIELDMVTILFSEKWLDFGTRQGYLQASVLLANLPRLHSACLLKEGFVPYQDFTRRGSWSCF